MLNWNLKRKHLREIAKKAIERKTGARGLRSIIEGIMLDVMFDFLPVMIFQNVSLQKKQYWERMSAKVVLKMEPLKKKEKHQHNVESTL